MWDKLVEGATFSPIHDSVDVPAQVHGIEPLPSRRGKLLSWKPVADRVMRRRIPSDRGLGDTFQRLFARVGVERMKAALAKIGLNCGCADIQADLNRRFPYRDPSAPVTR